MIPTNEQIEKMSVEDLKLAAKTFEIMNEEFEVDKMIFPAYLKQEQEEYNIYYKMLSRTTALKIDIGLTPIDHDGDIRRIAKLYGEGKIKLSTEEEFLDAQVKAQLRINKLLIK